MFGHNAKIVFLLHRKYKQLIGDLLSSINNRNMWVTLIQTLFINPSSQ